MPRRARRYQWTEAACYHVLNRGHARETIFHEDADRLRVLELIARSGDQFGFRLYHYCLMDNHFHLLLQLPEPRQLSRLGGRSVGRLLALLSASPWPGGPPVPKSLQEPGD
jgi:REP element-mobilizing transposase RayT